MAGTGRKGAVKTAGIRKGDEGYRENSGESGRIAKKKFSKNQGA